MRLNDLDGEVAAAAKALAAAEQQRVHAGRDYNDGLDQLEEAITARATSKELSVEATTRKNVVSLNIANVVTVELGYENGQTGFVALRTAGAHFYATNSDRYCPVPGGGQPDAAAMIAAIEASTSKQVEAVVGKPSRFMAEAILSLLQLPPEQCIMIGDRLETDVLMGLNAGMAGALTLTGATDLKMLEASEVQPTYVLRGLSDLIPESD